MDRHVVCYMNSKAYMDTHVFYSTKSKWYIDKVHSSLPSFAFRPIWVCPHPIAHNLEADNDGRGGRCYFHLPFISLSGQTISQYNGRAKENSESSTRLTLILASTISLPHQNCNAKFATSDKIKTCINYSRRQSYIHPITSWQEGIIWHDTTHCDIVIMSQCYNEQPCY